MTRDRAHADPARSMALLWRRRRRGPGPRERRSELSADRIAEGAIAVARRDGLAALTMRRVSEELGVGTMSPYTHVKGKGELLDLMMDTVYGELSLAAYGDLGWRERLERVAADNWALYRRHPWLAHAETGRPVLGPNLMAKYDHELSALAGAGLDDVEVDAVLTLVLGHVRSAARAEADAAEVERETGLTDEQWWRIQAPWLAQFATAEEFPTAVRVGSSAGAEHRAAYDPEHAFDFGLARLLDGVAVLVRERSLTGSSLPR